MSQKKERILTYNAWRGIAAIMILFSHMSYLSDAVNPFWHGLWSHFMHNGGIVTSFFFLSSGFFLNYSWKNQTYRTYIVGKLKRIYPLAMIVFVLALIVDILLSGNDIVSVGVQTGSALWFFNIVANIFLFKAFIPFETTFYSFHGPSWYISVLFAFYLIAYWFVRGMHDRDKTNRRKWLNYTGGGMCAAYLLQLILCIVVRINQWPTLYLCYIAPWFRIFGEGMAGILLCEYMAEIQKKIDQRHISALETIVVLVFIADFILRDFFRLNIWSAWLQILPMGLVLVTFRRGKGAVSDILKTRPFQFIGDVSFELYMTHAFVYEGIPIAVGFVSKAMRDWIVYHAGTRFVITFIACIVFAWIVYTAMTVFNKSFLFRRSRGGNDKRADNDK